MQFNCTEEKSRVIEGPIQKIRLHIICVSCAIVASMFCVWLRFQVNQRLFQLNSITHSNKTALNELSPSFVNESHTRGEHSKLHISMRLYVVRGVHVVGEVIMCTTLGTWALASQTQTHTKSDRDKLRFQLFLLRMDHHIWRTTNRMRECPWQNFNHSSQHSRYKL